MALRDLYIKLPGPSVMYHGLTVQRIHPAKGFQWPSVAPAVPCAGAVGTPMPKQIAGVLTFYDNTVTRAGRGRMYAPFPSKGEDSTAGSPVTTYIDALRAFGNLVKGAITLNDGQANAVGTVKSVLWHKASKAGTDITVIKPNAIWGTQRRRGDYGKANAVPAELPQT
jgi:hypothetical protein